MSLNITTRLTHSVDYADLEKFIEATYGFTYEIPAAEECSNDSTLRYTVDGIIQDRETDDLRKLLAGKWIPFRTGLILNLMCFNQEIPAGEYYVEVSW